MKNEWGGVTIWKQVYLSIFRLDLYTTFKPLKVLLPLHTHSAINCTNTQSLFPCSGIWLSLAPKMYVRAYHLMLMKAERVLASSQTNLCNSNNFIDQLMDQGDAAFIVFAYSNKL